MLTWFELVFGVLFTVVILSATFNVNENGDKKDFVTRYIALSLVITIRLFVFILIPLIALGVMASILKSNGNLMYENNKQIIFTSMGIVVSMIYFFMLLASFKRVNAAT